LNDPHLLDSQKEIKIDVIISWFKSLL
jgi:hypothetical protein